MKNYFLIGLGGVLGSVSRYLFERISIYHYHGDVPLNTLIINVTGSFLIALVLTIAFEIWKMDPGIRLAITTGFIGAFTTFSTLCKETANLIYGGHSFPAILYVSVSLVLGLTAAYFGVVLAREVISKLIRAEENINENSLKAEGEEE